MDYLIKADALPFKIEDTKYGPIFLKAFVMESSIEGFIAASNNITKADVREYLRGDEKGEIVILSREKNRFKKITIENNEIEEVETLFVSETSIKELGREFFEGMKDKLSMEQLGSLYPELDVDRVIEDLATEVSELEDLSSLEMFMVDTKIMEYGEMTLSEFKEIFSYTYDMELLEDYGFEVEKEDKQ